MSTPPSAPTNSQDGADFNALQQAQAQQLEGQAGLAMGDPNATGIGQNQAFLQQQALMAMAGGNPTGLDAGASREALMSLLTRQGLGAGGMGGMGGAMPGMAGGMGFQGQQFGTFGTMTDGTSAGQGGENGGAAAGAGMMGSFPNQFGAFGGGFPGFAPGMAGMAGGNFMGGAGMAGSVLGSSNLLGAGAQGSVDSKGNNTQGVDVTSAGMAQQNMLIQQMLSQQAAASGGSLWQQYGNMQGMGAEGMMAGAAGAGGLAPGYLNMLQQSGAVGQATRDSADTGVFGSGAMPDFTKSGKKSRSKKPKNKPKRPLSAYNIFFKVARAQILAEIPDKDGDEEEEKDGEIKVKKEDGDESGEKKEEGKEGEAKDEDGKAKDKKGKKVAGNKRKRKPHGKIGFESLAKIIGQKWKELDQNELDVYKKQAETDMKRYRKEMEAYVQKQREGLEQSREHLEKLVDEETKKRYFGVGEATPLPPSV